MKLEQYIKRNLIIILIFNILFSLINFSVATETVVVNDNPSENTSSEAENKTSNTTKMDDLQVKKQELETNLNESNSQMEIVKNELSELLQQIEELSIKISVTNQEIDSLTIENKKLTIYIGNVKKDLDKISEDYENKKNTLDNRLVAMYMAGDTTYLDLLLNSKDLISFISNYYLLSEIVEADEKLVEDVSTSKKYMENLKISLQEKNDRLERNIDEINKKKISLENMQVIKNSKVSKLSEQEKELFDKIEAYQTEIENVEKEIRTLSLANVGSEYIGGSMAWPVPGYTRITSPFGMRTHPITGIYKLHTGTDIGAPMGANFIAANDGIVLKAEYNGAYGNMVIIDHGGGITTLYAHGSQILVNPGDFVTQGTPILKVGSTGYSTGPHAHFEVRLNGAYQNPIEYITSYNKEKKEEVKEEKPQTETVVVNN